MTETFIDAEKYFKVQVVSYGSNPKTDEPFAFEITVSPLYSSMEQAPYNRAAINTYARKYTGLLAHYMHEDVSLQPDISVTTTDHGVALAFVPQPPKYESNAYLWEKASDKARLSYEHGHQRVKNIIGSPEMQAPAPGFVPSGR